jgi:hypothetical protein
MNAKKEMKVQSIINLAGCIQKPSIENCAMSLKALFVVSTALTRDCGPVTMSRS